MTDTNTVSTPFESEYISAELRNRVMELLFDNCPLSELLKELVILLERLQPGMYGSILLVSDDGKHLNLGAAPNLPDFYNQAIDGIAIGENVGSCGTAAYTGELVIVADIADHPYWEDYRELALKANLRACWSQPIVGTDKNILGTFAMYYKHTRTPSENDISLLNEAGKLAQYAIGRHKALKTQRMMVSTFSVMPYAHVMMDDEFLITSVNPAFSVITGSTIEDSIGACALDFLCAKGQEDSLIFLRKELEEHGFWHGELQRQRKNGEFYDIELTVNSVYNDSGKVQSYVSIFSDISERKKAERLVQHQLSHDTLTDLPNRKSFYQNVSTAIEIATLNHSQFGLLLLDLDNFKDINDIFGHDKGDELLILISTVIGNCLRPEDSLMRLGGDEFAVLVRSVKDDLTLEKLAKNILSEMSNATLHESEININITSSIGISVFPRDGTNTDELHSAADNAMDYAKLKGRNGYHFYTPTMQKEAEYYLNLTLKLKNAIFEKSLIPYYQPIINSNTGKIEKLEALIRWPTENEGFISPVDFIPVAEKSGLIREIGSLMRDMVFAQVKNWNELGHLITVSINISTLEFWDSKLGDKILSTINKYQLPPNSITVEITESVLMRDADEIKTTLEMLRNNGVKISIDDFGTGYSSLSYLANYPIDELKIDRSFIDGLESDPRKQALVDAMLHMSNSLSIAVVAEGVETVSQRQYLTEKKCSYLQGFLMSKPLSPEQMGKLLISGTTL